jgi:hypothetical protein
MPSPMATVVSVTFVSRVLIFNLTRKKDIKKRGIQSAQ